jgi:hypothetical protein
MSFVRVCRRVSFRARRRVSFRCLGELYLGRIEERALEVQAVGAKLVMPCCHEVLVSNTQLRLAAVHAAGANQISFQSGSISGQDLSYRAV